MTGWSNGAAVSAEKRTRVILRAIILTCDDSLRSGFLGMLARDHRYAPG
jgi:hypothetical protein